MKEALRTILYFLRNILDPLFNFREVSILCYHSISDIPFDTNVLPATFESHMQFLAKRGYIFVSLADIIAWQDGERPLPRKAVALTFDDGYTDFESVVLPLAQKYHAPIALFAVGDAHKSRAFLGQEAALLQPEAIERLRHTPLVEVGYHSQTHADLGQLSPTGIQVEVHAPFSARYFAYPGGQYSSEVVEAVKEAGYIAAFSIKPTLVTKKSDRYLLPRNVILKDMAPRDVALRASKAVEWYRALWRFSR